MDSNLAAGMLFNLENQIQGTANAVLHAKTSENLENIKANLKFEINDGFLPKLGNTEFMVTKFNMNRKIKVSSLTNADLTREESMSSDIKGSCVLNNHKLENIVITTEQKSFASLIKGKYNIDKQNAVFNIYGKYDKQAPKGVRILFIPLNWIISFVLKDNEPMTIYQKELDKIPPIECENWQEKYFKIDVNGNLNTEQIDVKVKGLK